MKKIKSLSLILIVFFSFNIVVYAEEPTTDLIADPEVTLENNTEIEPIIEEEKDEEKDETNVSVQLRSAPVLTSSQPTNNSTEPEQPAPEVPQGQEVVRVKPTVTYQTHVQNVGWMNYVSSGNVAGTTGQSLRLEGIKINLTGSNVAGSISYQVHVQNIGWMNSVGNNELSGTTGQSLRLEAIKINLTGELAEYYDIYYQVHAQNYGWLGWAKNGEEAGTAGFSLRLEAIKIVVVEKGATAPGNINNHYYEKPLEIHYNSHVQNIGWTANSYNGAYTGTVGESKRMEAVSIGFSSTRYSGSVAYQTHIQNIGWSSWSKDGAMSGTTGQSLRLEAIKITLEGEIANHYDVYYRSHIQNIGWMSWVKNGELSGTTGQSLRMEALEVKLVEKGGSAPVAESNFVWYYEGNTKILINPASNLRVENAKKIIDVSELNGRIDWNKVKNEGDIDGAIIRLGFGSYSIDGEFLYNLSEVKRLGIPYGVYLFSYAENAAEALSEANFVKNTLINNNANPTLGVYYDLENWRINETSNTDNISSSTYESMIDTFINNLQGYNASVYTYTSFASHKLNVNSRNRITWIAQYYSRCEYTGNYNMWQYTSSGSMPGIRTRVDMSVRF